MPRAIAKVVTRHKLGEQPRPAEYWLNRPIHERMLEVERIRRVWKELGGDPDQPIAKVVTRRKLGE